MATAKKATPKKTTTKKTTKKSPAKKTTVKSPAKKTPTKSTTTKKAPTKKTTTKTVSTKKSTAKASTKKQSYGARIIAIICSIVALLAVIAAGTVCIYQALNSVDIAGTYKLTGMEKDGKDQSDSLSLLKDLGLSASLELNEDKTGVLHLFGEDEDLTYNRTTFTIDGNETGYTYDDDKIIFEDSGTKLTFTKSN